MWLQHSQVVQVVGPVPQVAASVGEVAVVGEGAVGKMSLITYNHAHEIWQLYTPTKTVIDVKPSF